MERPKTDEQRIAAVGSTDFFELFAAPKTGSDGGSSLPDGTDEDAAWVALHNEGHIDLLVRCTTGLEGVGWSLGQRVSERIGRLLAHLDAAPDLLARFLLTIAGTRLSDAASPEAITAWFKVRPQEMRAVALAPNQLTLSSGLFTMALQAGHSISMARDWLSDPDDTVRIQALNALAWMTDDAVGAARTLDALDRIVDNAPDPVRVTLVRTLLGLTAMDPELDVVPVLLRALDGTDVIVRRQAAWELSRSAALLEVGGRTEVIDALTANAPEGTGDAVGSLIHGLLSCGNLDSAIRIATGLAETGSTVSLLQLLPENDVMVVVVKWFADDGERFGPGVENYFTLRGSGAPPLVNVPDEAIPQSPHARVLVAMKAMCWLLLQPVTVAALVVAFMSRAETDRAELTEMLRGLSFDHVSVREYLGTKATTPGAHPAIKAILDGYIGYETSLGEMVSIRELRPPDAHVIALRMVRQRRSAEIGRKAREQSSLVSLFSERVILHGAGLVHEVVDSTGKAHPTTMMMGTVRHEIALPAMSVIDPIGYDIQFIRQHFAGKRS